jgi:hypothetical protein
LYVMMTFLSVVAMAQDGEPDRINCLGLTKDKKSIQVVVQKELLGSHLSLTLGEQQWEFEQVNDSLFHRMGETGLLQFSRPNGNEFISVQKLGQDNFQVLGQSIELRSPALEN